MRRCDARCHTARQDRCKCICQGVSHGCRRGPMTVEEARKQASRDLLKRRPRLPRWAKTKGPGRKELERQLQLELPFLMEDPEPESTEEDQDITVIKDEREAA